jgi:hypothetical protein
MKSVASTVKSSKSGVGSRKSPIKQSTITESKAKTKTKEKPSLAGKMKRDDGLKAAFKAYEETNEYQKMMDNLQSQISNQKMSIAELRVISDAPVKTEDIFIAHHDSMPNFLHPSVEHELRQLRNERESLQRMKNSMLEQQDLRHELDNGFREIESMKLEVIRTILDHVKISTLAQFPFPMPPMYPPQPPQVVQ